MEEVRRWEQHVIEVSCNGGSLNAADDYFHVRPLLHRLWDLYCSQASERPLPLHFFHSSTITSIVHVFSAFLLVSSGILLFTTGLS